MCSSNGCGAASNTRRSICEPIKASARPVARSADISPSTIAVAHIRALTTAPRIKPTSIFLRSARRPNPGRGSTYRRGILVQTTGTSSIPHKLSDRCILAYQREFGVVSIVGKVDHFRGDEFQPFRGIIFMVPQDFSHDFLCRLQFVGMPCRMPLSGKGLCKGIQYPTTWIAGSVCICRIAGNSGDDVAGIESGPDISWSVR